MPPAVAAPVAVPQAARAPSANKCSPAPLSACSSPGASPGSPAGVGSRGGAATAPVVALDVQLTRMEVRLAATDSSMFADGGASAAGSTSARSSSSAAAAAAVASLEVCLACSGVSLSVQSMLDGLAVQVRTSQAALLHACSWMPAEWKCRQA